MLERRREVSPRPRARVIIRAARSYRRRVSATAAAISARAINRAEKAPPRALAPVSSPRRGDGPQYRLLAITRPGEVRGHHTCTLSRPGELFAADLTDVDPAARRPGRCGLPIEGRMDPGLASAGEARRPLTSEILLKQSKVILGGSKHDEAAAYVEKDCHDAGDRSVVLPRSVPRR
jgi:hypothetical protein